MITSTAVLATPLAALSQLTQQVRRIGFLSPFPSTSQIGQISRQVAVEALRRAGYEEGRNLAIAWRFAEEHPERLPQLAQELVRLDVELIIAQSNYPTLAAKAATRTIPIVMHASFLPVENRLIESLARPGGNVTGTASWDRMQTVDKNFQLLKEAVPHAKRIATLIDPNIPLNYQYAYFHSDEQVRNLAAIGDYSVRYDAS